MLLGLAERKDSVLLPPVELGTADGLQLPCLAGDCFAVPGCCRVAESVLILPALLCWALGAWLERFTGEYWPFPDAFGEDAEPGWEFGAERRAGDLLRPTQMLLM